MVDGPARMPARFYVQDERYVAIEHMEEVRPSPDGREAGLGHVRREAFQVSTESKNGVD
jgi:hypothetical protein